MVTKIIFNSKKIKNLCNVKLCVLFNLTFNKIIFLMVHLLTVPINNYSIEKLFNWKSKAKLKCLPY